MSLSLDSFVCVPIPIELYAEFAKRYPGGVSSILEHVVSDFLDRTAEDFAPLDAKPEGVYWEALFLPTGTELRTKHYGEYNIAEIVSTEIMWDGAVFPSISKVTSAMRGDTSNNAWKTLEIKRPTDAKWQPAMMLRPR